MSAGDVVPDLLQLGLARFPERPCVALGNRTLSFAATSARADRVAGMLDERGLPSGSRVALLALNELEFTEIAVGVQRAGMVLVPLNYRLAPAELAAIVADCRPAVIIVGPDLEPGFDMGAVERLDLGPGGTYEQALADARSARDAGPLAADAIAVMSYTSGTTSNPKGVLISGRALHAMRVSLGYEIGARAGDTYLVANPMFHLGVQVGYAFTYLGATCRQLRRFDPAELADVVERHGVTHMQLVPTMVRAVLDTVGDRPLPGLRRLLYGAAPMPPPLAVRTLAAWGCELVNAYGSTEAMAISMLTPEEHDVERRPELLGSVGRGAAGMRMRVVDDDDREVATGVVGEVVASGPNLMSGYWGNPEATAAALRGGWMHTGDLAYRDDEGYLFLVDRRNDRIVTGGENVYPSEVERVLLEHPDVGDAAVLGVPDERWGEAVCAAVVPRAGASLDTSELAAFVRGRLSPYKVPKEVRLTAELPRNATGKLLRRALRDGWSDTTAAAVAAEEAR